MNNIVLGTMNIKKNDEQTNSIIDMYLKRAGKNAYLDCAYYYGITEEVVGEILYEKGHMPKITTKVNPWYNNDFNSGKLGQLNNEGILKQINTSLENLKMENVEILFLHSPDYETPIETTLESCHTLWRREKFNCLGLSNFSLDQTMKIIEITEEKGYNSIEYYQGMYNIISRKVEEIFPLLEENNIDFWAYNPLAGGLLTAKYKDYKNVNEINIDSRFKNNKIYESIFWKPEIIENLQEFFNLGNKKCIEKSFEFLYYKLIYGEKYYTFLKNNKFILGCSNTDQLNEIFNIINNIENSVNKSGVKLVNKLKDFDINYLNELYIPIADISPNYWY